MHTVVY